MPGILVVFEKVSAIPIPLLICRGFLMFKKCFCSNDFRIVELKNLFVLKLSFLSAVWKNLSLTAYVLSEVTQCNSGRMSQHWLVFSNWAALILVAYMLILLTSLL